MVQAMLAYEEKLTRAWLKKIGYGFLWEITKLLDDVDKITWISRKHLTKYFIEN